MALKEPVAIYINRNTRHIPKEEFDIIFKLIHRALKKLPFNLYSSIIICEFLKQAVQQLIKLFQEQIFRQV